MQNLNQTILIGKEAQLNHFTLEMSTTLSFIGKRS